MGATLSKSAPLLQSAPCAHWLKAAGSDVDWLPRQAAALDEHKARLGAAASAVRELGRRREALLSGRLEAVKRREVTSPLNNCDASDTAHVISTTSGDAAGRGFWT